MSSGNVQTRVIDPDGDAIAVFPLRGALLLPEARLPLHIFEARYRNLVRDVLEGDRRIGMIQPQPELQAKAEVAEPPLYGIGCVGEIEQHQRLEDGRFIIILRGVERFRTLEEIAGHAGYRRLRVAYDLPADDAAEVEGEANRLLDALAAAATNASIEVEIDRLRGLEVTTLINSLPIALPFAPEEKQALLEADGIGARLELLVSLLEMGLGDDTDEPLLVH